MSKRICVVLLCLSCLTATLSAQDQPKAELYGGYSLFHSSEQGVPNLNGWTAGAAGYVNDWLGIAGEVGSNYGSVTASDVVAGLPSMKIDLTAMTFLVGPRFAYRTEKMNAFFQTLAGAVRVTASAPVPEADVGISVTDAAFAYSVGGGFDVHLSPRFSVRVGQLDWITAWSEGVRDDFLRYTGGIVIHF